MVDIQVGSDGLGLGTEDADRIFGTPDVDGIFGEGGDDTIFGEEGDDIIYGGDDNDLIFGGSGLDDLLGDDGDDTLHGEDGDDSLKGGSGNDFMYGGTGNDIYNVDSIGDQIFEYANEGIDSVESSINYTLNNNNLENLILRGSAIFGTGNYLDNILQGNDRHNTLQGKDGRDTLSGEKGNDTLYGGNEGDLIFGGEQTEWRNTGNDLLSGGAGSDTLYGQDGDDSLRGHSGDDTLEGGEDNDDLIGGSGNDLLLGGDGDNILNGADFFDGAGQGEVDILIGGNDRDAFILGGTEFTTQGNVGKVYYDDGDSQTDGLGDYALIKAFDPDQDTIQLIGDPSNYSLGASPINQISGVGIYFQSELIAVLQDASALELENPYFQYTGEITPVFKEPIVIGLF